MLTNIVWPLLLVVGLAVSGCRRDVAKLPSPPVPASCSSNKDMDGLHFSFNKWKEGLGLMFVDRLDGSVTEASSLDGGTWVERGSVRRADGTGYEWRLKTKDGRSADLTINDVSYDLTKGTLFAIQLDDDKVIVHQVDRDLSTLDYGLEHCTNFVNNSPDMVKLVTGEDKNK